MRLLSRVGLLVLVLIAACSQPEPLKMTEMDLSHEIDENNRPRSARETFAPTSTVYATMVVEGSGEGTLTAVWKDAEGAKLADQTQKITQTETTSYEFHLPHEKDWELGRYEVMVKLDDGRPRTRIFEIRETS